MPCFYLTLSITKRGTLIFKILFAKSKHRLTIYMVTVRIPAKRELMGESTHDQTKSLMYRSDSLAWPDRFRAENARDRRVITKQPGRAKLGTIYAASNT